VELEVDLEELQTHRDLRAGILAALKGREGTRGGGGALRSGGAG